MKSRSFLKFGATKLLSLGAMFALLLLPLAHASAAYPGVNGRLAYATDNDVYTAFSDATNTTKLGSGARPAWSADGTKITFSDNTSAGIYDIYIMNSDGTGKTKLTSEAANVLDSHPYFSPDGSQIVFASNSANPGSGSEIYVMNSDGTGRTQLTAGGAGISYTYPSFSPDGSLIVYSGGGTTPGRGIFTANADGTNQTLIFDQAANSAIVDYPDWSPDGSQIVFSSTPSTGPVDWQLWVMDADGTNGAAVTTGGLGKINPVWSPDGTKIAYAAINPDFSHDLFTMDADGNNQAAFTTGGAGGTPSWGINTTALTAPSGAGTSGTGANGNAAAPNAPNTGLAAITANPLYVLLISTSAALVIFLVSRRVRTTSQS